MTIIASKGTVEIFVNLQRRVLGIGSETSSKDMLAAYDDLDQTFTDIGMEPSNLMFIEFIGNFIVESPVSPIETLKGLKFENDLLMKIGVILEKDVANVGKNLTLKEANPTGSNWLHMVIEPLYPSPNKKYRVRTICRGDKEEVLKFVKNIEKRLPRIIEKIERK